MDPKAACEHYSLLAEHLVALLHAKVPSVRSRGAGSPAG
jgi:hypothetical protein